MGLPNDVLSVVPVPAPILVPDQKLRSSLLPATLLTDYELGGIGIDDPSQGLQVQSWMAYLSGNTIYCVPEAGGTPTAILTDTGITELSLSFTQSMNIVIAYVASGVTKLYWYDSDIPGQTTTVFTGATSPFLSLDDKRPETSADSDVLFFYVRSGVLYYREQRERYQTERSLATLPVGVSRIVNAGMGENLRVQIQFETF